MIPIDLQNFGLNQTSSANTNLSRTDDKAIFAVFNSKEKLEKAVEQLQQESFHRDEIATYMSFQGNLLDDTKESKLGEGLIIGTVVGIVLGVLLCWLIGLKVLMFHDNLYVDSTKTKLASILAGAGIGGMVCGVLGGIIGLILPEYEIKDYETSLREGNILVKVLTSNDRATLAKHILESNGGYSITLPEVKKVIKQNELRAS